MGNVLWIVVGQIRGNQINATMVYVNPLYADMPFNTSSVYTIINSERFSVPGGIAFNWSRENP
jgi:hypothetical protein